MSSAGQQLVAGRIPGERIATTEETSDSSTFTTTETVVISVTAALVSGRTYRVRANPRFQSTVAGDTTFSRMREDNVSGTEIDRVLVDIGVSAGTVGYPSCMEAEFTAGSTGNKTFVATGERTSGSSGTQRMEAASSTPSYMYVDYIRG